MDTTLILLEADRGPAWVALRNATGLTLLHALSGSLLAVLVSVGPTGRARRTWIVPAVPSLMVFLYLLSHLLDQRIIHRWGDLTRGFAVLGLGLIALSVGIVVSRCGGRLRWLGLAHAALLTIFLGCTLWGGSGARRAPDSEGDQPDLLLVVLDALQARVLDCYGSTFAASPQIDALASEGWVLDGAFSTAATSVPGHGSILTGLGVDEHRAPTNDYDLPADLPPPLAEVLRNHGYVTLGICHNPLVSRAAGFARGFDHYWTWGERRLSDAPLGTLALQWAPAHVFLKLANRDIVSLYARWAIATTPGPVFVFVQFLYTHDPYVDGDGWATAERVDSIEATLRDGALSNRTQYSDREIAEFYGSYLGAVAYSDRLLDEVRQAMLGAHAEAGLVTVISADHGENLAEHGDAAAGKHFGPWSTSLHIPVVLHDTRSRSAGRLAALTSQQRLMPFLLARSETASEIQRTTLEDILARDEHLAYSHPWLVLVDDSLKVGITREDLTRPPVAHRWREDFEDQNPLEVDARVLAMWEDLVARNAELSRNGFFAPPVDIRPEKLEDLKALGYIE